MSIKCNAFVPRAGISTTGLAKSIQYRIMRSHRKLENILKNHDSALMSPEIKGNLSIELDWAVGNTTKCSIWYFLVDNIVAIHVHFAR